MRRRAHATRVEEFEEWGFHKIGRRDR